MACLTILDLTAKSLLTGNTEVSGTLGFVAMLVVPALDHRFAWSAVPLWATLAGDVLVTIGFLIIFLVYKEDAFASATIKVYPDQKVISTGLYGPVRHPMYMGGLFLFVGMCLAQADRGCACRVLRLQHDRSAS